MRSSRSTVASFAVTVLFSASALVGCGNASGGTNTDGVHVPVGTHQAVHDGTKQRIVTNDGYQVILAHPNRPLGPPASHPGDLAAQSAREHLVRTPTSPDPLNGHFDIQQAVEGLGTDGTLVAEIGTDLGTVFCDLDTEKAPNTVANFIGLVRGKRPWWDARAGAWATHPYYRDTIFHRVIPGYLVQGGDYLGDGTGTVGYEIPDELTPDMHHDRAGQLCMAPLGGPNHNGAQFFFTDGAAPQLDGSYTIFGLCRPADIISHIARVPQAGPPDNRPLTPVAIARIYVRRVVGGAAHTTRTLPSVPPGTPEARGASRGPAELYGPGGANATPPMPRPTGVPPQTPLPPGLRNPAAPRPR